MAIQLQQNDSTIVMDGMIVAICGGKLVIGNQFARQEPGDSEAIRDFCDSRYGVSFPMFEKVEVNGPGTHPLYRHLKGAAPGLLGTQGVKWNFTKFLVARDGKVVLRAGPRETPESLEGPLREALDRD